MPFPQFRKYTNDKSFFKIISQKEFEELKLVGKYFILTCTDVKTMPDRNFLADMLENLEGRWEIIDEAEFQNKLHYCVQNLSRLES